MQIYKVYEAFSKNSNLLCTLLPQLLRYLYNNSKLFSIDVAFALLKHICTPLGQFPELANVCHMVILNDMRFEYVLPLYSTIHNSLYDRKFSRRCTLYLQYFAARLCTTEATRTGQNIFQLPADAMLMLFDNRLHIESDVVLFRGLLRWARSQMQASSDAVVNDNSHLFVQRKLRSLCNCRIALIRWSAMTTDEFKQCLDEIEPPNMQFSGYKPGFFTLKELERLTKGQLPIIHTDEEPASSIGGDHQDDNAAVAAKLQVSAKDFAIRKNLPVAVNFNKVDTGSSWELFKEYDMKRRAEMEMRDQSWTCRSLVDWQDSVRTALVPLLGGPWCGEVGGFIAFEVRDRCRGRRHVLLGGLTVHVSPHLLLSVHLLSGWTESKRCEFRFQQCQQEHLTESRLWLNEPVILQPDVLYRLVVTVSQRFLGQFAAFETTAKSRLFSRGPFWVPEVVAQPPAISSAEEVLLNVSTVNISTLYFDYL